MIHNTIIWLERHTYTIFWGCADCAVRTSYFLLVLYLDQTDCGIVYYIVPTSSSGVDKTWVAYSLDWYVRFMLLSHFLLALPLEIRRKSEIEPYLKHQIFNSKKTNNVVEILFWQEKTGLQEHTIITSTKFALLSSCQKIAKKNDNDQHKVVGLSLKLLNHKKLINKV